MKKIFLCFLALLIIVIVFIPTDAHSGGTDANGGHWDHSTGEYHYHHGKPAHQHTNGKCHYGGKDTTKRTVKKKESSYIPFIISAVVMFCIFILPSMYDFIRDKFRRKR